jgi:hypothetical protein
MLAIIITKIKVSQMGHTKKITLPLLGRFSKSLRWGAIVKFVRNNNRSQNVLRMS